MPRKLLLLLAAFAMACGGGGEVAPSAEDSAKDAALAEAAAANAARRSAGPGANASALVLDTAALAGNAPLMRETFGYDVASRDPFRAVISFESSGPELPDLRLVGILYDEGSPANSVATFRDIGSSKRYNVRPGDRIGRLLVASVQPKDVVLRMNDFGTVREQTYSLRKTEDEN
ncbi:MAG TPA: hypothetical protein PLJ23_05525 [Gemmatimonadales bacterium]|nr:hypothetical protein [Gemmatimonadales bacterium]